MTHIGTDDKINYLMQISLTHLFIFITHLFDWLIDWLFTPYFSILASFAMSSKIWVFRKLCPKETFTWFIKMPTWMWILSPGRKLLWIMFSCLGINEYITWHFQLIKVEVFLYIKQLQLIYYEWEPGQQLFTLTEHHSEQQIYSSNFFLRNICENRWSFSHKSLSVLLLIVVH